MIGINNEENYPTQFIVVNDGAGPYSHFVSPIGGFEAGRPRSRYAQKKRNATGTDLPDVLPIRLPTADDLPGDMASPATSPQAAAASQGSPITVVPRSPPKLLVKENGNGKELKSGSDNGSI